MPRDVPLPVESPPAAPRDRCEGVGLVETTGPAGVPHIVPCPDCARRAAPEADRMLRHALQTIANLTSGDLKRSPGRSRAVTFDAIHQTARAALSAAPPAASPGAATPPVCLLCLRTEAEHGNPPHDFMSNRTPEPGAAPQERKP